MYQRQGEAPVDDRLLQVTAMACQCTYMWYSRSADIPGESLLSMGFGGLSIAEMRGRFTFDVGSCYAAFISFWFTDSLIYRFGRFNITSTRTQLYPPLLPYLPEASETLSVSPFKCTHRASFILNTLGGRKQQNRSAKRRTRQTFSQL